MGIIKLIGDTNLCFNFNCFFFFCVKYVNLPNLPQFGSPKPKDPSAPAVFAVTFSCSEAPSVAGSDEEQHMLCDTVARCSSERRLALLCWPF